MFAKTSHNSEEWEDWMNSDFLCWRVECGRGWVELVVFVFDGDKLNEKLETVRGGKSRIVAEHETS